MSQVHATDHSEQKGKSIKNFNQLYINGEWVKTTGANSMPVVDPATEETIAEVQSASASDVDAAVAAAKAAFGQYSQTSVEDRIQLLERILVVYKRRRGEFAEALTQEMGSPITLSRTAHSFLGEAHLQATIDGMREQQLEVERGNSLIVREPAGVAGLITPWNWPINQVVTKVASALGAGCTVILKPSKLTPLDAILLAEVIDEANAPAGVFNLVLGDASTVGEALTTHPDIDVVSFTGSTRAGRQISKAAAETIKVVHLELGGKSPNIVLDDADLKTAVDAEIEACFRNAGQSCSVTTRMLVPRQKMEETAKLAKEAAEAYVLGDPSDEATTMGPLVNDKQFEQVQKYIQAGIDEGARLVTGGVGRPEGFDKGYYVKPTVFADVKPGMQIEKEEIFGPVLAIIAYDSEDEAIEISNDSIYGLAAAVQSADRKRALAIARRLHAGHVYINQENSDYAQVPFGGWKQSGTGYEHARWGMEGFQLIKSILGVNEQ